ncbi:hypothetical protein D046_2958B, partial [Vibrio parahaemolyticus V-223/04]
SN